MNKELLISGAACEILKSRISPSSEVFCRSLFFSARWFVFSQCASKGTHLIILPDRESAEYCASDLYTLIEGDKVFFLPNTGSGVEKSNYKSSLSVQRTTAVRKLLQDSDELRVIVTFPEALEEKIPVSREIESDSLTIFKEQEISHEEVIAKLGLSGFERGGFVSAPGQFAVRGSLIDFFSYSNNEAYRVSFWGNEIEKINIFDCNTQLSKEEVDSAEIVSNIVCSEEKAEQNILDALPESAILWLDSSDMYKSEDFFPLTSRFGRVYLDIPIERQDEQQVVFSLAPQPVFNKNFELLVADIRAKIENGYKVNIFCEKPAQRDRIRSILDEERCPQPEFISGCSIHKGFIDNENKVCCYTDHEIFDRFHRVILRKTV